MWYVLSATPIDHTHFPYDIRLALINGGAGITILASRLSRCMSVFVSGEPGNEAILGTWQKMHTGWSQRMIETHTKAL